ncbi:ArnT family glycosyltransferase [Pseudomonas rhizophila]
MIKVPLNERLRISVPVLLLIVAMLFFGFSVIAGAPIFASDEYVYFISGKFNSDLALIHERDPLLQTLSNLLYFSIVRFFYDLFGSQFVVGYRLVHVIEYLASALLLFKTVTPTIGQKFSVLGVAAFLMLPSQIYIYSVMPEIELVFISALLAYVMVRAYPRAPYIASALSGILIAIAILIKPHALAMLLATIGAMFVFQVIADRRNCLKKSGVHVLGMIIFVYITVMLIWGAMSNNWSLDPSSALGLSFYGQYIETTIGQITFLKKISTFLLYFSIHVVVLCLIFGPVIIWSLSHIWRRVFRRGVSLAPESFDKSMLAVMALALIGVHVAMTAWFTAGAALLREGEAFRLHGRYLGPALLLLPGLYFYAVANLAQRCQRITLAVSLFAAVFSLVVINRFFKIYPWDNPLLFAFFNSKNWYQWNYNSQLAYWGAGVYLVLCLGLVFCFLQRKFFSQGYAVFLFMILSAGLTQTYSWLEIHLINNEDISAKSRVLGQLIETGEFGDGVLVSQERFGRESYILFNLGQAVRPLDRIPGSSITPQDVVGASWLIVDGDYDLKIKNTLIADLQPLRLYKIESERVLSVGETLFVSLANNNNRIIFKGFNQSEEWGAWTSSREASIELPYKVAGRLKIKLSGWTLKENAFDPVYIKVGPIITPVFMRDVRGEYEFNIDVQEPTQQLIVMSKMFRAQGAGRTLGVALSSLSIEVIPVH